MVIHVNINLYVEQQHRIGAQKILCIIIIINNNKAQPKGIFNFSIRSLETLFKDLLSWLYKIKKIIFKNSVRSFETTKNCKRHFQIVTFTILKLRQRRLGERRLEWNINSGCQSHTWQQILSFMTEMNEEVKSAQRNVAFTEI